MVECAIDDLCIENLRESWDLSDRSQNPQPKSVYRTSWMGTFLQSYRLGTPRESLFRFSICGNKVNRLLNALKY